MIVRSYLSSGMSWLLRLCLTFFSLLIFPNVYISLIWLSS